MGGTHHDENAREHGGAHAGDEHGHVDRDVEHARPQRVHRGGHALEPGVTIRGQDNGLGGWGWWSKGVSSRAWGGQDKGSKGVS